MKSYSIFLFLLLGCFVFVQGQDIGTVSIYSAEFENVATASGELYDPEAFTGGHRSLPFGTIVRLRNLKDGRKIDVMINDRAAFVEGQMIEISSSAARRIGVRNNNKITMEVVSLGFEEEELISNSVVPETEKELSDDVGNMNEEESTQEEKPIASIYTEPIDEPESEMVETTEEETYEEVLDEPIVEEQKIEEDNTEYDDGAIPAFDLLPLNKKGFKAFDTYVVSTNHIQMEGYGLQMGIYKQLNSAMKKTAILQGSWGCDVIVVRKGELYFVIVGPFSDKASADEYDDLSKLVGEEGVVVRLSRLANYPSFVLFSQRKGEQGFAVSISTFEESENILQQYKEWETSYSDIMIQSRKSEGELPEYRILVGSFYSEDEAQSYLEDIRNNHVGAKVVSY